MSNLSFSPTAHDSIKKHYTQLTPYHDLKYKVMWCFTHATPRPCVTRALLEDIHQFHNDVCLRIDNTIEHNINYMVWTSKISGIYNLGGDLSLLKKCVENKDRESLFNYVEACIRFVLNNHMSLERNVTTISLVQGDALGGGLEAAMSCNVVIAERGVKMGIPDVLFNLFPGAGAYSLLSRKVGNIQAERIILSGKLYTGEEFYEMGIVDVLAENGQGEKAVYDYIAKENKARNTYLGMRKIKNIGNPVNRDELIKMAHVWVDAAMNLQSRDLRMMERLISRQSLKTQAAV